MLSLATFTPKAKDFGQEMKLTEIADIGLDVLHEIVIHSSIRRHIVLACYKRKRGTVVPARIVNYKNIQPEDG